MKRSGFTMVEVMVAMGILSMVGALVYGTIVVTLEAQRSVGLITERYHAGRVAISKMSRDLGCAFLSKHISILERNRETVFLGDEDKVTFTYLGHFRWRATTPESDQGVVSYYLKSKAGTKQLIRREKTILDDRPEKGGDEGVLVSGVKKLEFEYWDKGDGTDGDWTDSWKAELEDTDPIFLDKTQEKAHELGKKLSGMDQLEEDPFMLPQRVRIKLVLVDEEVMEYPFETEATIALEQPFNW